ncbi:alpha/beta hydrolase [Streptomyces sp. 549]|uniref:alpha/beta hydrolase n=1 Tax=Streptomyces sp. 549 TaxID=3049076 RepID=UPI0024C236D7|nr:alpha/beta hydrolase [Streptomyces sp. 549]MDK1473211.1 alpha/beta hydrolase [Streptomyces sp. 549]
MSTPARHRRAVALLTLTALVGGPLSGCTPLGGQPNADAALSVPAELRRFYEQEPKWKPCGEEECASLTVPMDYDKPDDGRTFTLPLIRAAATTPGKRLGSLVFNPGGPGESGIALLEDGGAESFSKRIRARFDIVGFDPRGVAGSKPAVDCGTDEDQEPEEEPEEEHGQEEAHGEELLPLHPTTDEQRRALVDQADSAAAACREHSGDILPHVGTTNAARDMDVLRSALGEERLTYLGWSYGTSLGTTYGELFPHRVRAMVLDGGIDPALDWSQRALSQAAGFRKAVRDFAEQCADVAGDACPGDTPREIRSVVDGLYEAAGNGTADLDVGTLHTAIVMSMYTPEDQWEELSTGLSEAAAGDGARLEAIAAGEEYSDEEQPEEHPDEEESAGGEADSGDPGTDEGEEDEGEEVFNSDDALTAVNCLDVPHPKDPEAYWKVIDKAHRAQGDFGSDAVVAGLSCRNWPTRGPGPHRVSADGLPPVLVVGTTGDPATPYEESVSLASQLPGGMLLTYEAPGHLAYGRGSACVDTAVDRYLIDLAPVKPGKTC